MKNSIVLILVFIANLGLSQNLNLEKWTKVAETDVSLQPKYGGIEKTPEQQKSDKEFIDEILNHFKSKSEASDNLVETGFKYLYENGDFSTAMRRFNQAYLLNDKNPDIYYGYGTIYFNLGAYDEARIQYDEGLALNPNHSEILTDYGTTYLADFYIDNNLETLDLAQTFLNKSYVIDKQNSNTIYKLSIVNMYLGNCEKAKSYLKDAKKLKNPNVTDSFEEELSKICDK